MVGSRARSTGAVRVFTFNYLVRSPPPEDASKIDKLRREPVLRVHIDHSYRGAAERMCHHFPDEADALLKKRFQVINVRRSQAQL